MGALFVTATGTDIGKTFVTAGLIAELRAAGRSVDAIKPVVSGFDPAHSAGSDPAVLLDALGRPTADLDKISPWRFKAPLAPDMAASREGRSVDFAGLVSFSRGAIARAPDVLLIEGVGGIMVPLDDRHTVLDWMAHVRVPLILVTGTYLGTISHTLSALDVVARRDLDVAAVVVSESPGSIVTLVDTAAAISRFCAERIPVLGLPRVAPEARHPMFAELARLV